MSGEVLAYLAAISESPELIVLVTEPRWAHNHVSCCNVTGELGEPNYGTGHVRGERP